MLMIIILKGCLIIGAVHKETPSPTDICTTHTLPKFSISIELLFFTDGRFKYYFNYMSEDTMEDILMVQTDQMSMKMGLKLFGGSGV